MVSAIGLGGHHIGQMESEREAIRLIHAAIDAGITFMDNAWEYHGGRSEQIMGKAIGDRRERVFLMTKVCTHGRKRHEAMRQLEVLRPLTKSEAISQIVVPFSGMITRTCGSSSAACSKSPLQPSEAHAFPAMSFSL